MSKIIEMRKAIYNAIVAIHPRVHFEEAPENEIYPYVVIDLPTSTDDGSLEQFMIDIDGWDRPLLGDTTELEELMESINEVLHRETFYIASELAMTLYRENRLYLRDNDKRIRRRKYIYQARTY